MILSKIAVLLDLTEMDAILLNYIKKLHESYRFESVLLMHFVEVEEFPHEIYDMYPELNDPIEKIIDMLPEFYNLVETNGPCGSR